MDIRDHGTTTTRMPGARAEAAVAALTRTWSGIWVGALTSVVAVVLFGFIGTAVGAQLKEQVRQTRRGIGNHAQTHEMNRARQIQHISAGRSGGVAQLIEYPPHRFGALGRERNSDGDKGMIHRGLTNGK